MQALAALAWVFRTWSTRNGRRLIVGALLGMPLVALAHLLDGYPAVLCRLGALALLGAFPGGLVLNCALLTVEARSRRPSGISPGRWRAQRLAVAACAGAVGTLWVGVAFWLILDAHIEFRAIPLGLVIGAALGLVIHLTTAAVRPR